MTGLIDIGGGMKGIYGAGVLDCFLDNNISFDYYVGVSAGSANISSFLAGQRGRNRRFFSEHSLSKQYMGFDNYLKTGSFFGLDYIYSELSNEDGGDPLDFDALALSQSPLYILATRADTGEEHYFSKEDMSKNNYKVFNASCAIPVFCKPVEIDGVEYFDGGVSNPIPFRRALDAGCDKIFVINANPLYIPRTAEKHRIIYTAALTQYPEIKRLIDNRHNIFNAQVQQLKKLSEENRAVILSPSRNTGVTTTTRDVELLEQYYHLAISDTQRLIDNHVFD